MQRERERESSLIRQQPVSRVMYTLGSDASLFRVGTELQTITNRLPLQITGTPIPILSLIRATLIIYMKK